MITEADGNAYEDSSRADSQPPSKRRCLELPTARSNVNKAKELTVGWIVTANLPFTAPSNPYLRRMLDLHDASLAKEVPWSRQSVRDTMRKLFEVKKGAISCQLEKAVTKISFSFDMWTSPNRYAFLGLHAHYLDASYQVQSRLLALRRVWGAHSGDNQATTIYDIFGEYGIRDRIGADCQSLGNHEYSFPVHIRSSYVYFNKTFAGCSPPRADQGRGREKHLPQHTRDEYTGAFSQAESLDDDHRRCIQISIKNCWSKLDEYYSLLGQSPLYPAAVILHPRWNVSWLEANWTSHEQLVWLRDAKNSVREFFEQQYPRKEQTEAARTMIGKAMRQDEPSQFDQWMQSYDRYMMEEEDELGAPRFRVRVNSTNPIFFYCGAPEACSRHHMMGVVNPSKNETLNEWLKKANDLNDQMTPGQPFPTETCSDYYVDNYHGDDNNYGYNLGTSAVKSIAIDLPEQLFPWTEMHLCLVQARWMEAEIWLYPQEALIIAEEICHTSSSVQAMEGQVWIPLTSYTFSSIANGTDFADAQTPMPIIVAIERTTGQLQIASYSTIVKFNTWEMGSYDPSLSAFPPLEYVGSAFNNGTIKRGTIASLASWLLTDPLTQRLDGQMAQPS
ncbi:Lysophospholipase, catalytic domain [Fusarium oxysporum f. sp. vasinfectum]|nr:Lysophospholipase, catalytic domain [Fusarium oxysporum f. sp. vasinfectum]